MSVSGSLKISQASGTLPPRRVQTGRVAIKQQAGKEGGKVEETITAELTVHNLFPRLFLLFSGRTLGRHKQNKQVNDTNKKEMQPKKQIVQTN